MQSRDPRAGEVSYLPGTIFLTCPVCGATSTILNPTEPTGPWLVDCTCGIAWRVRETPNGTIWINRRFDQKEP